MTADELKAKLVVIDPKLTKWKGAGTGDYTVWYPGRPLEQISSDDSIDEETQRYYIDRFTKKDNDSVAPAIEAMLIEKSVPYDYELIYEEDTGYIHHAFTCEIDR